MADNTVLNTGSGGDTIASDDIGGVKFQRVKLTVGADGTNDGDVATGNPMPTDLREVAGTAVAANAGNADAGTQRVVIATDQAVLSVDDNAGSLTVDNAALSVTGGGVESGALRVTLANDSTGVISVDDNAGSLTVDGIVTADAGTGFPSVQTEDAASAGGETGLLALGYRQDGDTSPVGADGDFHGLIFDDAGALKTNVKTSALPSGAATAANQLPDGHNVTVDNAAGASAVNIQDGGNVISVDDGGGDLSIDWAGTAPPIGAGTEASALRVTVATDSTGVLSIDDNAGSLTVDGTVTVDAGTGFASAYTEDAAADANPVGTAQILVRQDTPATLTTADGDNVARRGTDYGAAYSQIVDSSGNFVDTFGGGTQYTEDAAAAADPVGTAQILVRQDTPATLVTTDGDNVARRGTNYGAAFTQILDSSGNFINSFGGSGGTSHADDAAFTIGSASSITPMGALADETTPDNVDEGDVGVPRMTLDRKLLTRIVGATDGNRADVDASGHLQVDIAADSVGIGGGTQYTEDDAAPANPVGNALIAIRRDTPATETTTDGDITAVSCTPEASLNVELRSGTAETGVTANPLVVTDDGNAILVDGSAVTQPVSGTVTSDAGTGFPSVQTEDAASAGGETGLLALGYRQDGDTSPVTADGDFHGLIFDNAGALKTHVKTSALPAGAATAAAQLADDHSVNLVSEHTRNEAFAESIAIGGELDDTATTAATEGNVSPVRITAQRAVHSNLRKDDGTEIASGGGTEADALRITVANDSTGVLSVDDGGGNLSVDWGGTVPPIGAGTEATALRITVATDSTGVLSVDDNGSTISIDDGAGSITVDGTITSNVGTGTRNVTGGTAHDAAESGNPVGVGFTAREWAATAGTVSATNDRVRGIATPQGIQFVLGGNPNVVTREYMASTAQTNDAIIDTVAANSHIVLTQLSVTVGADTTVSPAVRIGFATATLPAAPTDGNSTTGIVMSHQSIAAGSGVVLGSGAGVIGVGASDEELRITCEAPTTGEIRVVATYWVATL